MDGPKKITVKKGYIEHKTEWKTELLFKTPDLRSHKFWKIKKVAEGGLFGGVFGGSTKTVVNFGRYGKKCRVSEKDHGSSYQADAFMDKIIRSKLKKGYFKVMMIGSNLGQNEV